MAGEILSSCRSGLGASQHFALPPTSGREAEMVDPPVRAIFSLMHCSTRNCWINPKTVPLSNDHRTAAGRNGPVPKDPVMVGKGTYRQLQRRRPAVPALGDRFFRGHSVGIACPRKGIQFSALDELVGTRSYVLRCRQKRLLRISGPRGTVFEASAAPPPKPAIACTS